MITAAENSDAASKVRLQETLLAFSLMAFFALSALMLALMPVVTPALQERFGLTASDLGLLTSGYLLAYALVEFPAGMAAGRWGGWVFAVSGLALVAGSVVFAASSSLPGFFAGRVLQGLGGGAVVIVGSPVLAHSIRPGRLGWAWGVMGAGWGVGTIAGLFLFPTVEQVAGFRAVLLVAAAICLAVTVLTLVQAPVRARPALAAGLSLRDYLHGIVRVATNREINLLGIFNAASLAIAVGALVWTPVFLSSERGVGPAAAAYVTAGLGLAQIFANPLGASAAGRWGRRPVIFWSLVGLAAVTILLPLTPGLLPALLLVLLIGFFDMSYFAPMFAAVPEVVELPLVGLGAAWMSVVAIGSSLLAPWLFGLMLDAGWGFLAGYLMLAAFAAIGTAVVRFFRLS